MNGPAAGNGRTRGDVQGRTERRDEDRCSGENRQTEERATKTAHGLAPFLFLKAGTCHPWRVSSLENARERRTGRGAVARRPGIKLVRPIGRSQTFICLGSTFRISGSETGRAADGPVPRASCWSRAPWPRVRDQAHRRHRRSPPPRRHRRRRRLAFGCPAECSTTVALPSSPRTSGWNTRPPAARAIRPRRVRRPDSAGCQPARIIWASIRSNSIRVRGLDADSDSSTRFATDTKSMLNGCPSVRHQRHET